MEGRSFGGSYYSRPPPPPPPASRHPIQGWSYSNPGSLPPYPPPRPISGSKSPYYHGFASPLVGLGNDVIPRIHPSLPPQHNVVQRKVFTAPAQGQAAKQESNSRSDWPTTPREDWSMHTGFNHTFVQNHQAHSQVQSHQNHSNQGPLQNHPTTYFRNHSEYSRAESSMQSYMSPSPSLSATFDALQIEERRQENSPSQPSSSNQIQVTNTSRTARLAQQELARIASLAAEEEENGPLYLGVGVNLRDHEHRIMISFIAAGSVAAQSGLLSEGDQIRMIDHTLVDGLSAQNVEDMLIGEEGSVVIITVVKPGEDGFTHATLVRKSSLREREENARKKKEIYDVGINLSVSESRDVRIVELIAGGPAAKLGYVNVGDSIVAIDEQPIPSDIPLSDLHPFVLSRVCGPKGTSVVLSLLKAGIGMRYHVQLRRTNLFGATCLRPRSENLMSMASTETSSAVTGSSDDNMAGIHSFEGDGWSQHLSPYTDEINPVPQWKAASWRPQLEHEVLEHLQRAVTECLTLVAGGGAMCYCMALMPNKQGEAWVRGVMDRPGLVTMGSIQPGDVIVEIAGSSISGAPFDHVAAALKTCYARGSSVTVGLYRPSARAVVHARLEPPDRPADPSLLRL